MCKHSKLNLNTFALTTPTQDVGAVMQQISFEYLHIYSPKVAIFGEKNSKIASLMSCQWSGLRKTLKYSQS